MLANQIKQDLNQLMQRNYNFTMNITLKNNNYEVVLSTHGGEINSFRSVKDGTKYVTGSSSFWSSFEEIYTEMEGEDEEWGVRVYRSPSKNYTGKDFITCSIC